MFVDYLISIFISMVPLLELRAGMVYAVKHGLPEIPALIVCALANMLPVPLIYFFARKVLEWGANKRFIGPFFRFCLRKGEKAAQKLMRRGGRRGLFLSMMLFVGIPIPGTGAWTGTLGASFLNMGIKNTSLAVSLGVVIAGIIMTILTHLGLHIFGY